MRYRIALSGLVRSRKALSPLCLHVPFRDSPRTLAARGSGRDLVSVSREALTKEFAVRVAWIGSSGGWMGLVQGGGLGRNRSKGRL